ncbi:MAG: precorrin-3B C(17)-methyltransferase [Pseudomonadota bacterium]
MAIEPVVVAISRSGEPVAHRIADALGLNVHGRASRVARADGYFENALEHVRALFAAGTPVIGVCASGILIRAVAPLLADKTTEPPVISVADDGSVVVPLLGGHRGANRLAREVAECLGTKAAVTTAGDVALGVSLDEPPLGWTLGTPELAKGVMADMLAGKKGCVRGDEAPQATWLADLPSAKPTEADWFVEATMSPPQPGVLTFHPQRVTLGVGCARSCPPEDLWRLVSGMLAAAALAPGAIHSINTIDLKADEPAILALSQRLGAPIRYFTAEELEAQSSRVENPSEVVFAEVGTHSVAEAAALSQSEASDLAYPKQKSRNATCAIGISPAPLTELRGRARGRVSLVGIGPGQAAWRTPEASRLVAEADEVVGYGLYIDLLGPLAAGKPRHDFPLGGEEARCRYALERAGEGRNVALICSGDAGIYAMGALVFELLDRSENGVSDAARRVDVISAPGVSALQAAAARAGAPLGHDFCAISLSDLLTPRDDILRRIKAAADGDFVIAFYNPVSKRRRDLLPLARDILLEHRPAETPVLLASSLGRPEEDLRYRELSALDVDEIDMLTVVLVGSSQSRLAALGDGSRMYTPRGYARKIDGDLSNAG